MTEHAPFFQASAAHRWMACPGSVKLCDGLEDQSSAYAEEGSQAHELAAAILSQTEEWKATIPDGMLEHVMSYVDAVRDAAAGAPILVEQRVDFSHAVGQPDCFGTADAIVIAGDEIQIHDLKYGMGVKVDAERNPQLMLYALGALRDYDFAGDFKWVRLYIHQVRLEHTTGWIVSVDELLEFAKAARGAADRAIAYLEDRAPPAERVFYPGDKQCRFCKAKGHCPALAAHVEETIGAQFENLDEEELEADTNGMGNNRLAVCMSAVDLVETWCKGIRARVERELLAGNAVDGWKLVQGRKGNREWTSKDEAEAQLRKMKLKVEDIYEMKVISPTTAEKLHKAGTIGPRQWPALQSLITQKDGGLSVAPASDKRPAATPVASASEFETLS